MLVSLASTAEFLGWISGGIRGGAGHEPAVIQAGFSDCLQLLQSFGRLVPPSALPALSSRRTYLGRRLRAPP
jgi:hypothetical protein